MPTALSKLFVKAQAAKSVSDVMAPLTRAIDELKLVQQQQTDLSKSKMDTANALAEEAGEHDVEAALAAKYAANLQALVS